MNRFLFLTTLLLIFSCAPQEAVVERPPKIAMEDFFKNPETFRYRLSPDGQNMSYLAPYENRLNIHVKNLETGEVTRVTQDTTRDIRLYYWANDQKLLYLQDTGGDENWQLFSVDKGGAEVKALTAIEGVRTEIIDDLPDFEDEVIVGLNKNNPQVFDPFRLNINTGEMVQLAENPGNITGWATDHEGKLRIAIVTDGVNQLFMHRKTEDDEFEQFISTSFKDTFFPAFFTFDNQNIYAVSNLGRNTTAVVVFDLEAGEEKEVLFDQGEFDITDLSYSRKRKVLTSAQYEGARIGYHFFDEESKGIYEDMKAQVGEENDVLILAATKAEDKYVFVTDSDKKQTSYFTYSTDESKVDLIADTSPWINPDDMADMVPIQYQARDGLTINGYLTIPKGVEAKNLPVVINPHGGPWARDSWGFNPEVQFLANRGYAVLQMNFRGSTGYGKDFWMKSFKEWGGKMQDDITDGVQYLVDKGIADPARIAIYGGSYGGYAALSGITSTPELYAACIDYVGVSNLFTFMSTIPPYWEPYLNMIYEMVGNPNVPEDSLMLRRVSPVFNADKIQAPLLIAQGAKDPRVNIDESNQIVEAVKKNLVDYKYIVKENEGHGFSNEENRFEFYGEMEKFLAKHIGDEREPNKKAL